MIKLKKGAELLEVKELWVGYFLARGYEMADATVPEPQEITAVLKPPKKKTAQPIPAVEAIEDIVSVEEVGEDDSIGDKS
jgi:hypothetical protein